MVDVPFKQSVIRMFVGFWGITESSPTFFVLKKPKQRQASKTLIFVQTKAISKSEIIEVYQAVAKKDPWSEWDASE